MREVAYERPRPVAKPPAVPVEALITMLKSIAHGEVQIIIQDGYVVQINKTEKIRVR
jgi:hypothetical protein